MTKPNTRSRSARKGRRSAGLLVILMVCFGLPSFLDARAAPAPEMTPPPMSADTKAAKALLAQLADLYQKASDLDYKSTLVVNGPLTDSGKPGQSITLLVTGAAEKPNKLSVKAFDGKKKLAEHFFSDGTNTYQYDPVAGYYEKMAQSDTGLDLPAVHPSGIWNTADYAAEFAAKMFFEDNPYDLSYAATDADTDVQFSLVDMKIGTEAVTQITETYTDDKGVVTTLRIALDKTTSLPRRVSQDITTGGQTRTLFTEDFGSIKVGNSPADAGTYVWQPKPGTVVNWTPPPGGGNS